jgi:hypothetical protein
MEQEAPKRQRAMMMIMMTKTAISVANMTTTTTTVMTRIHETCSDTEHIIRYFSLLCTWHHSERYF